MKILIIEDDKAMADIERDFLEMNGFEIEHETDGAKGMERALKGGFNLILLDLMLPGKDGFEICRHIRSKTDVPILMVTARIEDVDKIRGFGIGADDYISKPFSPTELVARVKAHIAQYERLKNIAVKDGASSGDAEIDLGYLKINPATRRVYAFDREVALTNKEYELLYFLVSNTEKVFSKEQLYDRIWGEDMYGDIKTVTVHIKRLREKTEKNPINPLHIQTVWGTGYRFSV
ncbi:response regulator transcription factor [Treponema primitia]|uniref:response regulator transcription factor n=1 Tax=Treponema primitia TaxID=88058 RepID=UPI0002554D26|nr:response regulator transcription factor [Treponema primitia]